MAHSSHLTLVVVVSGQPITIKTNIHQKVEHLVEESLKESGNKGQPAADWELRTSDGRLIEQTLTVESAGIAEGMTLYLSPKAGAGGTR